MLLALENVLKGLKILTSMPSAETPNYLGDPPQGSPRWYAQQYFQRCQNTMERMYTRLLARTEPATVDLTPGEVAVLATEPQHLAQAMVRERLGLSLKEAANVIHAFQEKNGRRGELHEHYPFPVAKCAREGCSGKAQDASPGADENLRYCSVDCVPLEAF